MLNKQKPQIGNLISWEGRNGDQLTGLIVGIFPLHMILAINKESYYHIKKTIEDAFPHWDKKLMDKLYMYYCFMEDTHKYEFFPATHEVEILA